MELDEILKRKRAEILRIAARHGAHNVRLFGSAARAEADAASDIDILVDMAPDRSLLDLGALWRELNDLLGVKVDVVTEKGLRDRIRDRVLKEVPRSRVLLDTRLIHDSWRKGCRDERTKARGGFGGGRP